MTTQLNRFLPIAALLLAIIVGGVSCKSKQKVSELSDKNDTQETMAKTDADKSETKTDEEDEMEAKKNTTKPKEVRLETRVSDYFAAIANAPSIASANSSISEALNLFESPDALVLIVISEYNGKKDYDKPTTIREYLNYLKDQKKNINRVGELTLNSAGKIAELELYKK